MSLAPDGLRPLIVPTEYWQLGPFPAVRHPLGDPQLTLTCVLLHANGTMEYVRPDLAASWEAAGMAPWPEAALAQLRTADEGLLWTHERRAEDGTLLFLGFMNPDGLGSSRLLLHHELVTQFPEGYLVALPDRSCGLAISASLSDDVVAELTEMVSRMQADATTPMYTGIHSPAILAVGAA